MENNNQDQTKVERMASEVSNYVNLKLDAFKLAMVENLSLLSSNALAILIFALLAFMALLLFTAAFVVWFASVLGSMTLALLITGLFFIIVAVVVFSLRNKLIIDKMVRMFSQMFFKKYEEYDYDEE